MPKRARSKWATPLAIISMAQHARPNVAGHMLFRRAHLTRFSRFPVRKLCWRFSRPTGAPSLRGVVGADTPYGLVRRPPGRNVGPSGASSRAPVECTATEEVHEGDEH